MYKERGKEGLKNTALTWNEWKLLLLFFNEMQNPKELRIYPKTAKWGKHIWEMHNLEKDLQPNKKHLSHTRKYPNMNSS